MTLLRTINPQTKIPIGSITNFKVSDVQLNNRTTIEIIAIDLEKCKNLLQCRSPSRTSMIPIKSPQPIFRCKQEAVDVQDLAGLLRIQLKIKHLTLYSGFYTRIDQVFLLWGAIAAIIFFTAQFMPIDWVTQASIWSILTLIGTLGTVQLAWYWVTVEQLRWVVYCWVALMLGGLVLTNVAIFGAGWSSLLLYLCPLWLGLSGVGYLCTAWGLRSRTFLLSGTVHLFAISLLFYFPSAQYSIAGIVTAGILFLLAEVQWDMQSTSSYAVLTVAERDFNQQQRQLRQL
jgi:hypothetical protein